MNLYDDLGVSPDADEETLRRAHRKAVQRTHPDKGGDREEFEKVTHAYLVLRDPKTRQRYDETGEHETAPNNELAEISSMLIGAFDQAMQTCAGRFDLTDLIATTKAALNDRKIAARANVAQLEAMQKNFRKVLDRLSFTGGGIDLLGSSLNSKLAETDRMLAACTVEIATIERAEVYAGDYGYRFDVPPRPAASEWSLQEALNEMARDQTPGRFFPFR